MRRGYFSKNPIAFVFMVVSVCCLLIVVISILKVPDVSPGRKPLQHSATGILKVSNNWNQVGTFGEMMIQMLPDDLAFTVFVPSETAFRRDLRLAAEKGNNTYAVISRVLGFSAVPRTIDSDMMVSGQELSYDSLSGFTLFISKVAEGVLAVNRVRSEKVDIRKGKIVMHIMDGVIMDAEFEQSVQPDYNGEE
ncbi:hypothetical protein SLE2022_071440 [Rubroshorea leprosula]